jgi:hypothetical protein
MSLDLYPLSQEVAQKVESQLVWGGWGSAKGPENSL